MVIQVSGRLKLVAGFTVDLDITVEEFEALSQRKQDSLIEHHLNWYQIVRHAEVAEIEDGVNWAKVDEEKTVTLQSDR